MQSVAVAWPPAYTPCGHPGPRFCDASTRGESMHRLQEGTLMAALATALFLGIVVGSIYSLSAFGLVLTYRASGVFNFAHGAVGMVSAFAFYQLVQGGSINLVFLTYDQRWKLPSPVAFVVV